jgi:hypothetical protein
VFGKRPHLMRLVDVHRRCKFPSVHTVIAHRQAPHFSNTLNSQSE